MTYQDAIAALETAKLSGDVAAIIAAADALAKAGSDAPSKPKPARKPRTPKDDRPVWFTETAKAKAKASRIKHSLAVAFADGQRVQVNAWQVATDRPIAVGRALHVAIEFIRQRQGSADGFRLAVPAIESVQLVEGPNDGEAFDGAECSRLTESARARIDVAPRETADARIIHLRDMLESARRALAHAEREKESDARLAALAWTEADSNRTTTIPCGPNSRLSQSVPACPIERAEILTRAEASQAQCDADIRTARKAVVQYEAMLAEAGGRVAQPSDRSCEAAQPAHGMVASDADRPVSVSEVEETAIEAIYAEPCEPAYPDVEEEPAPAVVRSRRTKRADRPVTQSSDTALAKVAKARATIARWDRALADPRKFQPVMRAEYDRAFDALEKARDDARKADPVAYARAYPEEAFAMRHLLPEAMARALERAETDVEIRAAVAAAPEPPREPEAPMVAPCEPDPAIPPVAEVSDPVTFTWHAEADGHAPNGMQYILRSMAYPTPGHFSPCVSRDDRLAIVSWYPSWRRGVRGRWEARFWIGYDTIKAEGASAAVAMRRLEEELDRRSIGIFGADDTVFEGSLDAMRRRARPVAQSAPCDPQEAREPDPAPKTPAMAETPPCAILGAPEAEMGIPIADPCCTGMVRGDGRVAQASEDRRRLAPSEHAAHRNLASGFRLVVGSASRGKPVGVRHDDMPDLAVSLEPSLAPRLRDDLRCYAPPGILYDRGQVQHSTVLWGGRVRHALALHEIGGFRRGRIPAAELALIDLSRHPYRDDGSGRTGRDKLAIHGPVVALGDDDIVLGEIGGGGHGPFYPIGPPWVDPGVVVSRVDVGVRQSSGRRGPWARSRR